MLASPNGYNGSSPGDVLFTGADGRPTPEEHPTMHYTRLLVPPYGRCDDPVGYATAQLLLSLLC